MRIGIKSRWFLSVDSITVCMNFQRITLGGRFTQLRNGSLLIHTAMEVDAGDYKCTASNDAGSVSELIIFFA